MKNLYILSQDETSLCPLSDGYEINFNYQTDQFEIHNSITHRVMYTTKFRKTAKNVLKNLLKVHSLGKSFVFIEDLTNFPDINAE